MKIRNGFVSNSSSSSFVAAISKLTKEEIEKLLDYQVSEENEDGWQITLNDEMGLIEGYTVMDNGSFGEWIIKNGFNKVRIDSLG